MLKLALLAAVALFTGANAELPIVNEKMTTMFQSWKNEFGVVFDTVEEEEKRFLIFIENLEHIIAHNLEFDAGEHTFDLALNRFAHLTNEEFRAQYNKYQSQGMPRGKPAKTHTAPLFRGLTKAEVDWREQGAVTPIKNQAQCGSCWAFSAVEAIEGATFLAKGELPILSPQMLVDCVKDGECDCTHGGLMDWGFEYVINVGGIVAESDDPYTATSDNLCAWPDHGEISNATFAATISSYNDVEKNNEEALKSAVAQQPVSIAIDASSIKFQFYHSGVYNSKFCCKDDCSMYDVDHGVLAVGYGHNAKLNQDYWIVKNSWGEGWGQDGYIYMARNQGGACGIAVEPSYPVV